MRWDGKGGGVGWGGVHCNGMDESELNGREKKGME